MRWLASEIDERHVPLQANMAAAMMQQQSGYGNYMMMGMPGYQQALMQSMQQVAARHQAAAHQIAASVQQQVIQSNPCSLFIQP